MIKKIVHRTKGKMVRTLQSGRPPIIIAGLGRCGTTLLYESLQKNHFYKASDSFLMLSDSFSGFKPNVVYKTHDYPSKKLDPSVKLIFMFGNPMNTAISSHRRINEWGQLHHQHLNSDSFVPNDDIFYSDSLQLNRLMDAWNQNQNFEFLSVRYETLYTKETIEEISKYLGFQFRLLPERKRKTDWTNHPMKATLLATYNELNQKINNSDNFKLWKKG